MRLPPAVLRCHAAVLEVADAALATGAAADLAVRGRHPRCGCRPAASGTPRSGRRCCGGTGRSATPAAGRCSSRTRCAWPWP
ncbi:hypothetical protein LT493_16255 [Streptomyces tricolor]|nr:hypothetical protein [Streptomyces tricolor]